MAEMYYFGNKTSSEILDTVTRFHGWAAPGVIIGTIMVDHALACLPAASEKDAIVETYHCLPDAVQLFTPCTFGNGWMKVLDWDRFALTLYDKKTLAGYRVWLDLEKLQRFPVIDKWYRRLVPKKSIPLEELNGAIFSAGREMLSGKPVLVTDLHGKKEKGAIAVCANCGEPFVDTGGAVCEPCAGRGYFRYV